MKHGQSLSLLLLCLLFVATMCNPPVADETAKESIPNSETIAPEGFKALFNGVDLEGWYTVSDGNGPDSLEIFRAENGTIHAYPSQKDGSRQSFAGLVTKEEYSSYILTFDFKWGEKKFEPRTGNVKDAGVLFHIFDETDFWPYGVECQIQEGDLGDLWIIGARASARVDASEHYATNGELKTKGEIENKYHRFSRSFSWEVPGWNKVEVEVNGDHATFTINGKVVNEAIDMKYWDAEKNSWEPLTKGKILLQAEGAEIFYRNVFINQL
ncbi:DUF1080 domain-containing protein [uncultured Imperialibacter sp.]|uniref:3-keto-disaccharide hydrolase n=1 Tax=uncultured Imperialibacter sp. TaxID=1672639 RepID=UPI0030DA492F